MQGDIAARSAAASEASAAATRLSVDLATRSLDVSQNSLEMDQCPWLYLLGAAYEARNLHLEGSPDARVDTIVMTFKNYGKTPAFELKVKSYIVSDSKHYLTLSPWDPSGGLS